MLASFADSLAGFHSMFCYVGDPRKLTKKNGRRFEMRGKKNLSMAMGKMCVGFSSKEVKSGV